MTASSTSRPARLLHAGAAHHGDPVAGLVEVHDRDPGAQHPRHHEQPRQPQDKQYDEYVRGQAGRGHHDRGREDDHGQDDQVEAHEPGDEERREPIVGRIGRGHGLIEQETNLVRQSVLSAGRTEVTLKAQPPGGSPWRW